MTLVALITLVTALFRRLAATDVATREKLRWYWNEIRRTGAVPLGYRINADTRSYSWVIIAKGEFANEAAQLQYIRLMTPTDAVPIILKI